VPIRLFNRTTNRICLALGVIMLLYYWDWMMRQLDNNVQTQDTFAALTLLSSFIGQCALLFAAANKPPLAPAISLKQKLSDLVVINSENITDYHPHHQKLDRDFVIKALHEIYQDNLSDRCKITCLLNKDKFEFEITIASEATFDKLIKHNSIHTYALYKESNQKIYLRRKIYQDSYDNKQQGLWPAVFDGKPRHRLFLWGTQKEALPNNGFPQEQLHDLKRVKDIIDQDIQNLKNLHHALDHPQQSSKQDKKMLAKLAAVLKAYKYKFTLSKRYIQPALDELAKTTSYTYDSVSDSYRPSNHMYAFEYDNQMINVIEYNLKRNPGLLVTLTDDIMESDNRKLKDLFLNLEMRFENIKKAAELGIYTSLTLPSEYAATIDEVLAPFSHPLPEYEMTLREIIFPGLAKIEKERRSEEHNSCLIPHRKI
jgi:hypothetical protein